MKCFLTDAIRITLGPKSKSVLMQKSWGVPVVCNDGVAIAKELNDIIKEEDPTRQATCAMNNVS